MTVRWLSTYYVKDDRLAVQVVLTDEQYQIIANTLPPEPEDPDRIGCYLLAEGEHFSIFLESTVE